jgi:hypothetical protein
VMLHNGLPSIVVGLFPVGAVELLGNWDVIGLVGTGSVDYRVPAPRPSTPPSPSRCSNRSCAVGTEARTMARLSATYAAETALEVAGAAFRFGGSAGLRNGSAIQRCYRDLSAGEQHVFTDHNSYRDAGRLLLGVGPDHLLR